MTMTTICVRTITTAPRNIVALLPPSRHGIRHRCIVLFTSHINLDQSGALSPINQRQRQQHDSFFPKRWYHSTATESSKPKPTYTVFHTASELTSMKMAFTRIQDGTQRKNSNSTTSGNHHHLNDTERHIRLEYLSQSIIDDDNSNSHNPMTTTIAIITLNRQNAANAMGSLMLLQLQEALQRLENDCIKIPSHTDNNHNTNNGNDTSNVVFSSSSQQRPRCVIITSYSSKVFSAGADLKERLQMTLEETDHFVTNLRNTFQRISNLSIPVIACMEGMAFGGGLEIALACDIRIASSSCMMGLPETSLGIIPGAGGTQRLSRLIGIARAKELIWTNRRLSGTEAEQYGIVQHVVPPGQVYDTAISMAWKISKNTAPTAIAASKYAIDTGMEEPNMIKSLDIERHAYRQTIYTKDRIEGLRAFQEKRKPIYRGE